jgi:hypothetical protein
MAVDVTWTDASSGPGTRSNEGYLAPLDEANERRERDTKFTKTQNWDSPAHFSGGGLPG